MGRDQKAGEITMLEVAIVRVTPDTVGISIGDPANLVFMYDTSEEIGASVLIDALVQQGFDFAELILEVDTTNYIFTRELHPLRFHAVIGQFLKSPELLANRVDPA
jgi:hypothetical protein